MLMEFPEAGRQSARKFLESFLSKVKSSSPDQASIVTPNFSQLTEEEAEAECIDLAKGLLLRYSCPGLLAYRITATVVQRLFSLPLDPYHAEPSKLEWGDCDPTTLPSSPILDGQLLASALVSMVIEVCEEWSKELPSLFCAKHRPVFSAYSMKNNRRRMEDRYAMCVDINNLFGLKDYPDQSYFAVYDGHMGSEAAVYSSVQVHYNIIHHPAFRDDPATAVGEGIKISDDRFCQKVYKCGSTAVFALLRENRIYLGWVGDSQAMLFRRNQAVTIMTPHKPDREDEQERIEKAGGMVLFIGTWRVNGTLAVSRAIGDSREKKFVVGDADVSTTELDGTEDYLVVACDGIWDVVNGEEMVECVQQHFLSGGSMNETAKSVVEFARREGSNDNLTCIVIFFSSFHPPKPAPSKLEKPPEKIEKAVKDPPCSPSSQAEESPTAPEEQPEVAPIAK